MSESRFIPPEQWARDHFSTLAFAVHCVGANNGVPTARHMRTAPGAPQRGDVRKLWTGGIRPTKARCDTRLKGGVFVNGAIHDDWSCLEDCEAIGILVNVGTGLVPRYVLTDEGYKAGTWVKSYMDTRDNGRGANTMKLAWSRIVEETSFDQDRAVKQAEAVNSGDIADALQRMGA